MKELIVVIGLLICACGIASVGTWIGQQVGEHDLNEMRQSDAIQKADSIRYLQENTAEKEKSKASMVTASGPQ